MPLQAEDKRNIHILSANIKFICTRSEMGLKCHRLAFLPVSKFVCLPTMYVFPFGFCGSEVKKNGNVTNAYQQMKIISKNRNN
jgi:hypothetical protein